MPTIVGVRFKPTGKTYYFDPCGVQFKAGEGAIVETSRGAEFAIVVIENKEVPDSQIVGELKPVRSKATSAEIERYEQNLQRKPEIMRIVREKIENHGLDMHLKDMDFSYDNSKMTFYYSADDRVDFRELVKDLGATLRTRVELRQIGIRDETKMLGGLGSCGRPCCCNSFLNGFERVSIKMAKVQGLSLNPVNISGLCGRLMCCLKYENEHYLETSKIMPKLNETINTPDGEGKVDGVDLLRRNVKVQFSDENGAITIKTYNVEELNITATQDVDVDDDGLLDDDIADVEELILQEEQEVKQPQPQKPAQKSAQKPRKEQPKQDVVERQDKTEVEKHDRPRNNKHQNHHASSDNNGDNKEDRQKKNNGEHKNYKDRNKKNNHSKHAPKQQEIDVEVEGEESDEKKTDKKPFKKHKKHKNFNKHKHNNSAPSNNATAGE